MYVFSFVENFTVHNVIVILYQFSLVCDSIGAEKSKNLKFNDAFFNQNDIVNFHYLLSRKEYQYLE